MRQRDFIRVGSPETPREAVLRMAAEVAEEHFVDPALVLEPGMNREAAFARGHLWHRLKTERRMTLTQIGRAFGRDHSTIFHGLRRYQEMGR